MLFWRMLARFFVITLSVSLFACGEATCGDVRMVDRESDRCVCRPEFVEVGDLCLRPDEIDAGQDGGSDTGLDDAALDSTFDGGFDTSVDTMDLPQLSIACPDPDDVVGSEDRVDLAATIVNTGANTSDAFDVVVELLDRSSDEWIVVASDRVVGGLGSSRSISLAVRVPDVVLSGPNDIRCVVDATNEVAERDESDNSDGSILFATGLPDVTVAGLSVSNPFMSPGAVATLRVENVGRTAYLDLDYVFTQAFPSGGGGTLGLGSIPFVRAGETFVERKETWGCIPFSSPDGEIAVILGSSSIPESNNDNNRFVRSIEFVESDDCF